MKNTFFLLAFVCTVMITITSCSEETFGIQYELVSPEDLTFAPGDVATFTIEVSNESGIDQINVSEQTIPYSLSTLYRPVETDIELTFAVEIPKTQESGSELSISVSIIDTEGNILEKTIEVSIEE